MKKIERQSEFSLIELIDLIGDEDSQYPDCFLINEIGVICFNGDDENQLAENFLLSLLHDDNMNHRAIGFGFLTATKTMAEKHKALISKFRENIENEEILALADGMTEVFLLEYACQE